VQSAIIASEHSASHDAEGLFATGDVAVIGPGRFSADPIVRRTYQVGGEWISSVDLENCACGHPEGADGGRDRVKHPKWEERPLLLRRARPGLHADPRVRAGSHRRALCEVAAADEGDPSSKSLR